MAFGHGKKQAFKLDNSAGVLVALTSYIRDIAMPRGLDTAEVSVLNTDDKAYIPGQGDGTISLSGPLDPVLDAHMDGVLTALKNGTLATASFEYGPQGSASGAVRYYGECILTSYEPGGGVGGAMEWSAECQLSGAVTRGVWP